jgi:quinol monooxygenase YgiN
VADEGKTKGSIMSDGGFSAGGAVVKPGQLDNFRALTGEMVESRQSEVGVLSYERFLSEDGTVIHIHERYADSASALAHLATLGQNSAKCSSDWWTAGGSWFSGIRAKI